jgi:hypothetical protein
MPEDLSWLDSLEFVFAKTMPDIPHRYVKRTPANEEAYVRLFRTIQERGQPGRFRGRRYRYWFCENGYKYWAMTSLLAQCWIINRAPIEHDWNEAGPGAFCRRCGHTADQAEVMCVPPPQGTAPNANELPTQDGD